MIKRGYVLMTLAILAAFTVEARAPELPVVREVDSARYQGRWYEIAPDGQRFLMIKDGADQTAAPASLVVVQHWLEELKRLVPTK